ncbi:helix-turn-helix domain-containing protein [Thermoproteus tenax]|uniref:Predicted transcriptional regulator n=1 Tax=Thermoproteus tenax (strain ATCC 35583 / DSM 2078 / JCM 9277 / NBRC 100435 / Kra 1) TaxID=768679 RepID=G4RKL4_THETK|nr:helix-turn-helix domain-containing protein [Thermoproteus tenax]CCC82109.1 Predicted transcriptional regulator [Thermoproteus tenax Kra 1]
MTQPYKDVAMYIAGDIIMSESPGEAIKRWRLVFGLTQTALAVRLNTSPSVISDYESGRRKFPGARFVKRLVQALIEADLERGGPIVNLLMRQILREKYWTAVIDMRDFTSPVPMSEFLDAIDAEILVEPSSIDIYGYTLVDSIKLVLDVPSNEYLRLYGTTSQRAAIFTKVSTGRSPVIAVKAMSAVVNLKPAVLVLHGVKEVDSLAIEICKREYIPLAVTNLELEALIENLRRFK